MPGSYHRNCVKCGSRIQMRQMPAGQWLPFEGYDIVHVCGVTSPNNSQRSDHQGDLTRPQGNRVDDSTGYAGLGFLDFDLPGQDGPQQLGQPQRSRRRRAAKRTARADYARLPKPEAGQSGSPVLQPGDTVSNSPSKRTILIVVSVAILALTATYLVWNRRANKNPATNLSAKESTTSQATLPLQPKLPTADEYYQQGVELTKQKRYDDAAEAYRQAISQNANMAEAHHELGYAYIQTRQWEKAVSSLKQTISLKPDFAESHRLLGDALSKLSKWEEAKDAYQQVIRMQPNSVTAYLGLGAACKKLGQSDEAVTAYLKASELKPNNAAAHYELGLLYLDLGDPEAAQAECDLLAPLNAKLAKSLQEAISGY